MKKDYSDYQEVCGADTSYGDGTSFSFKILVKSRNRELDLENWDSKDLHLFTEVADTLQEGLYRNSKELDPEFSTKKQEMLDKLSSLFVDAGLNPVYQEEIPNDYCSQPCCAAIPWAIITSEIGRVKIGWRKSVLNIDWSDTNVKEIGQAIFKGEKTTVEDKYIHAWSYEDAIRYLKKLYEVSPVYRGVKGN